MVLDKQEISISSDLIKRFIRRSVEKERYLFLSLCSVRDADKVLGKIKMDANDFERLSFLISQLGFQSFGISFDMEHHDFLEKLGNDIKDDIEQDCVDMEAEQKRISLWENQFIDQLPTKKMKENIRKVFRQG